DAVRPMPPPPPEVVPGDAATPAEPPAKLPPGQEEPVDPFEDFDPMAEGAEPAASAVLPLAETVPPPGNREPRRAPPSVASILVTVWLLGALLYLTRASLCLGLLYRRAWQARPVPEEEWA